MIVNLVVKRVKKMVPAWSIPGYVTFHNALAEGAGSGFRPVESFHNDYAFLQYTGGTTGVSKGAALTNSNVLSNAAQINLWLAIA